MERIGLIERAFQLAGNSDSLKEVRLKLLREGYVSVDAHLAGAQIKRDLKVRLKSRQDDALSEPHTRSGSAHV